MNVRVQFRLVAHKDTGLRSAPRILERELRGGLEAVGKALVTSSRIRMRMDTGVTQKSLITEVRGRGGGPYKLTVYSELVQAFVDAYGLHRGVFPPFDTGTRIYGWALRRAKGLDSDIKGISTPSGPARPRRAGRSFVTAKRRRVTKVSKVTETTSSAPLRHKARNAMARRIAFLIARAIYRRGIKASHWNKKALEANRNNIINQLQNALYRAANAINRA